MVFDILKMALLTFVQICKYFLCSSFRGPMRNEELLVSNFEYFGGKLIKHFICDLWLFILILILSGLRNNGKQLERKPPHAPELGTEFKW